jgi:hypothetical protein
MREVRRKRVVHEELVFEEKRLRFGAAPGEEERLPVIQALLAESTAWFEERGIAPDVPDEASVARALDLLALYDIVYRIASKTTHHSFFSMLTGFEGEPAEGMLFPAVPLHKPTPALTENVLLWAIMVYGSLLGRAEPIVRLGIADEIAARLLAYDWHAAALPQSPTRIAAGNRAMGGTGLEASWGLIDRMRLEATF